MIQPIETIYRGYRFRSRLEARWAVFFDAIGITWEYEPEGYRLSDGTLYLPDFWLPTFGGGTFVEVGPKGKDFSKAWQLCRDSKRPVWKAEGEPACRVYWVIEWFGDDVGEIDGIPCFDQAIDEDRMFWQPGYEEPDGTLAEDKWLRETRLWSAVHAAKQARFEHGETGVTQR